MKTITKERLSQLPKGFQESIIERSNIKCAIDNANTFKKYAKQCLRYHKENPDQQWDEQGLNSLLPYYNELIKVQDLADKYHALWGEKFYKCKLECEKLLQL
jgi:hypothetical protein